MCTREPGSYTLFFLCYALHVDRRRQLSGERSVRARDVVCTASLRLGFGRTGGTKNVWRYEATTTEKALGIGALCRLGREYYRYHHHRYYYYYTSAKSPWSPRDARADDFSRPDAMGAIISFVDYKYRRQLYPKKKKDFNTDFYSFSRIN